MPETVAVLGASPNPDRYAHKAMTALAAHGHTVIPVNPNHDHIDGQPCHPTLAHVDPPLDTITVYLRPDILRRVLDDIAAARPARVILNPGTEDEDAARRLTAAGIHVQTACTLVLLRSGQY